MGPGGRAVTGQGVFVSVAAAVGTDVGVHDVPVRGARRSRIRVGGRVYSVPLRLIGHTVETRQRPSTVEVLCGGRALCTMPRLRGAAEHWIDYRHIIGSLVRSPTLHRVTAVERR